MPGNVEYENHHQDAADPKQGEEIKGAVPVDTLEIYQPDSQCNAKDDAQDKGDEILLAHNMKDAGSYGFANQY